MSTVTESPESGKEAKMIAHSKYTMHIAAFTTVFMWSLANVLTRIAVLYYTPDTLSFLRYAVASFALLGYAFVKKMRLPALRDVPWFVLGGATGFAGFSYAFNLGARTVPASIIGLILNTTPIVTAIFAWLLLRENIGRVGWFCVGGAFFGVGIITFSGDGLSIGPGISFVCLSAVFTSIYNIFQRKLLERYNPLEITTYCIAAGALLLSVFLPKSAAQLAHAPAGQIANVVVLGLFPTALAYLCWAFALSIAKNTNDVINYMFLIPILTIALGCWLLGELPRLADYAGGAIIILSVAIAHWRVNDAKG